MGRHCRSGRFGEESAAVTGNRMTVPGSSAHSLVTIPNTLSEGPWCLYQTTRRQMAEDRHQHLRLSHYVIDVV